MPVKKTGIDTGGEEISRTGFEGVFLRKVPVVAEYKIMRKND